jgi:hypothetical protein
MRLDIEQGARLSDVENDYDGLRLRPDRCRRGEATAAISRTPVLGHPANQNGRQ